MSEALVEAGLALYPESEDILAIASLMAMQRQDWGQASSLLRSLIDQQGVNATLIHTLCWFGRYVVIWNMQRLYQFAYAHENIRSP